MIIIIIIKNNKWLDYWPFVSKTLVFKGFCTLIEAENPSTTVVNYTFHYVTGYTRSRWRKETILVFIVMFDRYPRLRDGRRYTGREGIERNKTDVINKIVTIRIRGRKTYAGNNETTARPEEKWSCLVRVGLRTGMMGLGDILVNTKNNNIYPEPEMCAIPARAMTQHASSLLIEPL